jgi:hypothetical protein
MECVHLLFQGIQFGSHFIKLFYHHLTIRTSCSCAGISIAGEVLEGTGNLSSYLLIEFPLTGNHHISLVAYPLLAETSLKHSKAQYQEELNGAHFAGNVF